MSTKRARRFLRSPPPHTAPLPWPIEMLPPARLRPADRNARTHSKKQIRQLADGMKRFGYTSPVIIDAQGRLIAGHARVDAAKLAELKLIPAIRIAHLTDTEIRAYMLADNQLVLNGGWNREALAIELQELQIALPEVDLEISITGFEPAEVDSIISDFEDAPERDTDLIPETKDTAVARPGDLFVCGSHRLLVADAREPEAYLRLMGSASRLAEMVITDPPYNVKIKGHVGGRGRIKHREFMHASGEMRCDEFEAFLTAAMELCTRHTANGGMAFWFMDWRHAGEILAAGRATYDELKNICIWDKIHAGQGTCYRSRHEMVFVFKKGDAAHINNFELGQHGRTRTNIWSYPGVNSFRAGRMDELKMHPTVKPVALVADAIKDCSRRGGIVLDVFAGSGTTIIAAERVGRRAFCMEIDPLYADVAIRRWQHFSGKDAILERTGQSFDSIAEGGNRIPARPKRPGRR